MNEYKADIERSNTIYNYPKDHSLPFGRPSSEAKYCARKYSPMTRFKKNLEHNRITSGWKMSAYRA